MRLVDEICTKNLVWLVLVALLSCASLVQAREKTYQTTKLIELTAGAADFLFCGAVG